jgi:hypothetical protein
MSEPAVATFFYGSYINLDVLRGVDLVPERVEVARLAGYDLSIRPLANLVPSGEHTVYGIIVPATHDELERLYAHAREVLGGVYVPFPVLPQIEGGYLKPTLCYMAPAMRAARPDPAYVRRVLEPAREYGFPDWYVARIESFLE